MPSGYAFSNKPLRFFLLSSLASAALTVSSADAAILTLTNGDRIAGELLQSEDGLLVFRSENLGEIRLPRDKVRSVMSEEGESLLQPESLQSADSLSQAEADMDKGQAEAASPADEGAGTAEAKVAAAAPAEIRGMKYSGQFDVGGTFNRGNSNDDQFNVLGELVARTSQHRYTFGLAVNEGRSSGETTTSNRRLHGQYDAFLNERDFLFVRARAEQDEMADLDLRAALGGGVGRQFLDNEVTKLSAQVGVNYVNEDYADGTDQSFPTLSIGLKYDHKFFERKLVYFQYMDLDTSLRDTSDTLLRTRLGLRVPITQGLNVSTQLNHDYANQPAEGKKKSDTALIFSVGYGF